MVASGDLSTTFVETGDEVEVAEVEVVAEAEEVHDSWMNSISLSSNGPAVCFVILLFCKS